MVCQEKQRLLPKIQSLDRGVDVKTVHQEMLNNGAIYPDRKTGLLKQ